ncbi:uncharacterized protein LOC142984279 [Anticarsia gemmatalis]|uniref:uncharacterized protein LOC142984279 n=1 Tax=Anticarsia gemmatalis TaxID=129554 RepID=UPI003F75F698
MHSKHRGMTGSTPCCATIILIILFTYNVNSARLPDRSLELLSKLLGTNPKKLLIAVVRSDDNGQKKGLSKHNIVESDNADDILELSYPQLNKNPRLKLRQLANFILQQKNPLRQGCFDSCEEPTPDPCAESDECKSESECEDSCEVKPKGFRQKTNKEVYEYLKRNPPKRVEPPRKKKNMYDLCDGSTKGPEWKCDDSGTKCNYVCSGKC